MNPSSRTRLATLAVLALVFGVGVLSGLVGDRLLGADASPAPEVAREADEPREARDKEPWESREGGSDAADLSDASDSTDTSRSRWLIHRVDLSDEQRMTVDSVLAYYRSEVRSLTDDYNNAYWSAVQSTRDELRQILSADQRARYDSLLVENDRRRGRDRND